MHTPTRFTLALALAAGALAGCGRNNVSGPAPGSSSQDEAAITGAMVQSPAVIEDGEFESSDPTTVGGGASPAAINAAITPLRYWRTITHVDRRFEFAFADSDSLGRPRTAIVTVLKHLTGRFNILTGLPGSDSTALDSAYSVIHKPLDDRWVRRIQLRRTGITADGRPVWRIVATSGVKVTAKDATTHIVSVRVQADTLDASITEPLRFFPLRRMLRLAPGTQVTVTVTTERNDDVVVLQLRDHRFRFHNNGDNTYTGVWKVPALAPPGPHHFGVNALSHSTLFDDQAPYDSQAWLLPFVITPDEVADALP
jgi:hypothetical protein